MKNESHGKKGDSISSDYIYFGILEQQAFGMIFVNIGQQLGTPELASLITSLPGIALGIVCVIYGSLGDFVSLKR